MERKRTTKLNILIMLDKTKILPYLGSFIFKGELFEIVAHDKEHSIVKGIKYPPVGTEYISLSYNRVDHLRFESLVEREERLQTALSHATIDLANEISEQESRNIIEKNSRRIKLCY